MLPLNLFLRAYFILFGLASTTFTYRLINVLWLFNWPSNFSFLIVIVLKQDSPSLLNPLTTEHQPYLTQYFTSGEPLHSKHNLSTAFYITIPLGGFEEHLPIHDIYGPNKMYRFRLAKGNVITVNSFWDGHLGDLQYVSVLERCPSYRESNKGSKERQGPTLSVRLIEVPFKRE